MSQRQWVFALIAAVALLISGAVVGPISHNETLKLASESSPDTIGFDEKAVDQIRSQSTAPSQDPDTALSPNVPDGFVVQSLSKAADGGFLMAGVANSQSRKTTIAHISTTGDTEWVYQSEPDTYTSIAAVAPGTEGGAYVVQSSRRTSWTPSHGKDATLLRIDNNGAVHWQRPISTSGITVAAATELATNDDGVVIAHNPDEQGVQLSEITDGNRTSFTRVYNVSAAPESLATADESIFLAGIVSNDAPWLLKVGSRGQTKLNRTYSEVGANQFIGAVPTDDGGAILAAWHHDGSEYSWSPYTARVNSEGTLQWEQMYSTDGRTKIKDVFTSNNTIVMLGSDHGRVDDKHVIRAIGLNSDSTIHFQTRKTVSGDPTAFTLNDGLVAVATTKQTTTWDISSVLGVNPLLDRPTNFSLPWSGNTSETEKGYCGRNRQC